MFYDYIIFILGIICVFCICLLWCELYLFDVLDILKLLIGDSYDKYFIMRILCNGYGWWLKFYFFLFVDIVCLYFVKYLDELLCDI